MLCLRKQAFCDSLLMLGGLASICTFLLKLSVASGGGGPGEGGIFSINYRTLKLAQGLNIKSCDINIFLAELIKMLIWRVFRSTRDVTRDVVSRP